MGQVMGGRGISLVDRGTKVDIAKVPYPARNAPSDMTGKPA